MSAWRYYKIASKFISSSTSYWTHTPHTTHNTKYLRGIMCTSCIVCAFVFPYKHTDGVWCWSKWDTRRTVICKVAHTTHTHTHVDMNEWAFSHCALNGRTADATNEKLRSTPGKIIRFYVCNMCARISVVVFNTNMLRQSTHIYLQFCFGSCRCRC